MSAQKQAENLGIVLKKTTPGYLNLCIRSGNQLITSGHVSSLKVKLGADCQTDHGYEAVRECGVSVLKLGMEGAWHAERFARC